jgi:hypothetical protein
VEVRGEIALHPHLNPPPSRGRKIVGYFHEAIFKLIVQTLNIKSPLTSLSLSIAG